MRSGVRPQHVAAAATAPPDASMIADHVQEVVGRHQAALFLARRCAAAAARSAARRTGRRRSRPASRLIAGQRERVAGARRAAMAKTPMPIAPIGARPELDLVARQPAGGQAAGADADRGERGQHADPACRSRPMTSRAEQNHHELQQRAEKPEVRDADDRQPQHAIAAQRASGRSRSRPTDSGRSRVPGAAARHVRNAEARRRAGDGDRRRRARRSARGDRASASNR